MQDVDWLAGRGGGTATPKEPLTREVLTEAVPSTLGILAQRADNVYRIAERTAFNQQETAGQADPRVLSVMLAANRAIERVVQLGLGRMVEQPQEVDEQLAGEERIADVLAELERIAPDAGK